MDQQLHGISPVPVDIGKLGTPSPSAKSSEAFIFEPTDLVPFEIAWDWQRDWQKRLLSLPFSPPAVWLLQHTSCYTLGRGATAANLLFDFDNSPIDLYRVDRGGEVTHHLPGQLVVYPVLDLQCFRSDLHWYLRELEAVVIEVLKGLGLVGMRIPGLTGIWIEDRKVAAIGVGCRRWITQHGFALNVTCDLKGFDEIVPCGLKGKKIGRLDYWLPGLKVEDVQPLVKIALSHRFDLMWTNKEIS